MEPDDRSELVILLGGLVAVSLWLVGLFQGFHFVSWHGTLIARSQLGFVFVIAYFSATAGVPLFLIALFSSPMKLAAYLLFPTALYCATLYYVVLPHRDAWCRAYHIHPPSTPLLCIAAGLVFTPVFVFAAFLAVRSNN